MVSTENLARVAAERSRQAPVDPRRRRQATPPALSPVACSKPCASGTARRFSRTSWRVRAADQKDAFNGMHEGDFLTALQTFQKAGTLHWTTRQSDTLKQMAAKYMADVTSEPEQKRFMFAFTNKDVQSLNIQARALHRQRGELGEDHTLATKDGLQAFAKGDRIQFTGNARKKADRAAGFVNGRVGTVEALVLDPAGKPSVTVLLDTGKGDPQQRVQFTVGANHAAGEFDAIKHGWAGTIYRGQGRTIDTSYVAHSSHWRAASSYGRPHPPSWAAHIFAARETVKDLTSMARGMARPENKRAASAYCIDVRRHPLARERSRPPRATASSPAVARPRAADSGISVRPSGEGETAKGAPPASLAPRVASAIRVMDAIFGALLGETSAPRPRTAAERQAVRLQEIADKQTADRAARLQEISRSLGAPDSMNAEELEREREKQGKRGRDPRGGRSL